ncbi:hypothetical protein TNCV_857511 [Trichonephila clavipes]|nr:hypothetical protein TNCV_857511 [Trichonephila clavipes]
MLQSTNEPTESRRLKRRIIHEEVQKMLDEGIVQPSESPWSSPIVLEAGLKLNSKCLFAAQEVKILGHLVSSNGVRPDPDKIKAEGLPDGPSDFKEHDFDVKYKTGKKHSDADALSRNPVEEETETSDKFLAVTTYEPCDGTEKGSRPCEIKTFEQLIQKRRIQIYRRYPLQEEF